MVLIRIAQKKDIPHMTLLLKDLFSIESDFQYNAEAQERGLSALLTDSPLRCILVAEVNESIIGMISGQLVISSSEGGYSCWIEDVIVNTLSRGKGIGALLMKGIEEWCASIAVTRMQLLADSSNESALGFYDKNNWKRTKLVCLRKQSK